MRKSLGLLALLGACLALAVGVTTAGAVSSAAVRASGVVEANGTHGPAATFKLMINGMTSARGVSYEQGLMKFHSTSLTSILYGKNAVKVQGVGVFNGKTVHFTAVGVSHPLANDVFKISWGGRASHGGLVTRGRIRITPTA